MTYEVLRYLISAISIILIALIYKFFISKKEKKSKTRTFFIVIVVIWIVLDLTVIWNTPFENKFMSFDTLEKSFNYSYNGKITNVIEGEDYAFVVFNNIKGVSEQTHFIKENGKWKIHSPAQSNVNIKLGPSETTIITDVITEKNVMLLSVGYSSTSEGSTLISDSINSKFELTEKTPLLNDVVYYEYTTVIKNIPEDYYLTINEEKVLLN